MIFFLLGCLANGVSAQQSLLPNDFFLLENRYSQTEAAIADTVNENTEEFPSPTSVMFKSMIIPGWGQVVNRQVWKVPIVYGLFAGVGIYTHYLHDQYTDYRAAYYNAVQGEDNDFRFGATPGYLEGVSTSELLENRTSLRNRRDFMFVVLGMAYGLNILDAYVFAHMRSFDVSDDLTARATLQPALIAEGSPGIKLSFSLSRK
ncbi:MAG: DUF5683 domain-containing protein [Balneolaceae bacterium]